MNIPKKIHYCWFGNNPLDDKAKNCIESWKKFFPDYEIIQWDENNFDVSLYEFMKSAYNDKKWAFVSDIARLMIVYEHGGIYFDTDVEVIAFYDDILQKDTKGFIGFEKTNQINSGLGFGAVQHHPFLTKLLECYKNIDYDTYKTHMADIACTVLTTQLMMQNGLKNTGEMQNVCDFIVYPPEYFSPIDYYTGKLKITKNTHSIHWYNASWQDEQSKMNHRKNQMLNRMFGLRISGIISGILNCIRDEGLFQYTKKRIQKYIFYK